MGFRQMAKNARLLEDQPKPKRMCTKRQKRRCSSEDEEELRGRNKKRQKCWVHYSLQLTKFKGNRNITPHIIVNK